MTWIEVVAKQGQSKANRAENKPCHYAMDSGIYWLLLET